MPSKLCASCSVLSETDKPFCPECGEFFTKAEESQRAQPDTGSRPFVAWVPLIVWVLLQLLTLVRYNSMTAVARLNDPLEAVKFLGPLALVIFIGVKFGKTKSS
jgi:predicted nucleic acid-binding Zn ribbon protein